jgi:hypothetical protein
MVAEEDCGRERLAVRIQTGGDDQALLVRQFALWRSPPQAAWIILRE